MAVMAGSPTYLNCLGRDHSTLRVADSGCTGSASCPPTCPGRDTASSSGMPARNRLGSYASREAVRETLVEDAFGALPFMMAARSHVPVVIQPNFRRNDTHATLVSPPQQITSRTQVASALPRQTSATRAILRRVDGSHSL